MKRLCLILVLLTLLLGGCAPSVRPENHDLERQAIAGTHALPPPPTPETQIEPLVQAPPQATATIGTGSFFNERAARAPLPSSSGAQGAGTITFNFENQPIQAAVKAILGDVLHENYVIAPGVQGTVTFSTSQPVEQSQVLSILEMLLSWTNNALVHKGGRYIVMPAKEAAGGNLVPGLGAAAPGTGYAARLFPLHYVSAEAMQKLLKPFARSDAFLLVDPQRNVLVMAGTPDELANYQRTIRTFDVDWLRGMSVAVIPLQHVETNTLMPQLDQMFGSKSDSPVAGMARFIPLEHSNSIVVITSQPSYVDEVRDFIAKIDAGAGGSSGLYVYDVKNIKASNLAEHLNALYNGTPSGQNNNNAGAVAPGFSPLEQGSKGLGGTGNISNSGFDNGNGSDNDGKGNYTDNGMGGGDQGDAGNGINGGLESGLLPQRNVGNNNASSGTASYTTQSGVRIAAVDENNQLLVRARPSQWQEMLPVIERLDQVPLQVQIETRVLEVDLTGQFSLGVQYYLAGLIGTQPGSPPGTNESFHRHQGAAGLGGVQYNPLTDALFYSFAGSNLQFAIRGLEESGNTKILSEPSTVVLNNHQTQIKVGDKIPVVQTYYTPGVGVSTGVTNGFNAAQVQYIDTGVLLDVTPRVNPGGLVYLNIQQVVSKPTTRDQYGNYTIANRTLSTQVAVQSGQTVLLGGLIQQNDSNADSGVPFLNRIPVLGRLFGTTTRNSDRQELIVLITPRVIGNAEEARALTDEYQTKFESLKPILQPPPAQHSGATTSGVKN